MCYVHALLWTFMSKCIIIIVFLQTISNNRCQYIPCERICATSRHRRLRQNSQCSSVENNWWFLETTEYPSNGLHDEADWLFVPLEQFPTDSEVSCIRTYYMINIMYVIVFVALVLLLVYVCFYEFTLLFYVTVIPVRCG